MITIPCVFLCVLYVAVSWAATIDIKPNVITVPVTRNLVIVCSLKRVNTPELSALFSLTLLHSNAMDEPKFTSLASVNTLDNKISTFSLDESATVAGLINNSGESFLRLTWKNPMSEKSGLYRCSFNGVGVLGNPLTLTSTGAVVVSVTDYDSLTDKMKDFENSSKELKAKFDILSDYTNNLHINYNSLISRLSRSRDAAFYSTSSFNGSRYYLPRDLDVLQVTWAQATCELYGGHLAEIDSNEEFHFVRNFLVSKNLFDVVVTGANDEEKEGTWIYNRNKAPLKVFNWATTEPNSGRIANCQCFWKGGNWYMADARCVYFNNKPNDGYVYSYLCEMPESSTDV
ncbi:hypothetical protein BgiBS90_004002 [Biomphalaria glabrata]|nr:hypothetical protein BgiBS90_004002 [Biomphalaria glabrata]